VRINGTPAGNLAVLPPNTPLTISMDYLIDVTWCPGCIAQIQVGIAQPAGCVYEGVPGSAVYAGSGQMQLVTPNAPGVYYVGFDMTLEFSCIPTWGRGPPTPNRYIAAFVVQ
jgi:hypothetical protein